MDYYAHSASKEGGHWHLLKDHLSGVSQLCFQFAHHRPWQKEAELAGRFHEPW